MTACGHARHVGTCPECQRTQLARWRSQLEEASAPAHVSGRRPGSSHMQWNRADPTAPTATAALTRF